MATQVATQGVPLAALAADAPESYTVRAGDTLWHVASLFLRQAWRWPELWGMNMQAIANPHLIYPGQRLYLVRGAEHARLSTQAPQAQPNAPVEPVRIKLSPSVRSQSLSELAIPTLQTHLIAPFLDEPLVVLEPELDAAARVIAAADERLFIAPGDQVYARSSSASAAPLELDSPQGRHYRIFRETTPLLDPVSKELLGYEAQYVGRAELIADELPAYPDEPDSYSPATLLVRQAKQEVRAGDRLLPEPQPQHQSFVPHAPAQSLWDARVVSLYGGNPQRYGSQHHIITINQGHLDGAAPGLVLSLMTQGRRMVDTTDAQRSTVRLPQQLNGTVMVFRVFERVSYALVLDVRRPVQVGDVLASPAPNQ